MSTLRRSTTVDSFSRGSATRVSPSFAQKVVISIGPAWDVKYFCRLRQRAPFISLCACEALACSRATYNLFIKTPYSYSRFFLSRLCKGYARARRALASRKSEESRVPSRTTNNMRSIHENYRAAIDHGDSHSPKEYTLFYTSVRAPNLSYLEQARSVCLVTGRHRPARPRACRSRWGWRGPG